MFSKTPRKNESPHGQEPRVEPTLPEFETPSRAPESAPRSVSYVGPTLHLSGEITANESLVIEGVVQGRINHKGRTLTVGKQGRVKAEIHANMVDVRGMVEGDIYGEEIVHLFSTAVVNGTIYCSRLVMDDGAQFNGTCDMQQQKSKPAKGKLSIANSGEHVIQAAG